MLGADLRHYLTSRIYLQGRGRAALEIGDVGVGLAFGQVARPGQHRDVDAWVSGLGWEALLYYGVRRQPMRAGEPCVERRGLQLEISLLR
jgi:hypothetical protein